MRVHEWLVRGTWSKWGVFIKGGMQQVKYKTNPK